MISAIANDICTIFIDYPFTLCFDLLISNMNFFKAVSSFRCSLFSFAFAFAYCSNRFLCSFNSNSSLWVHAEQAVLLFAWRSTGIYDNLTSKGIFAFMARLPLLCKKLKSRPRLKGYEWTCIISAFWFIARTGRLVRMYMVGLSRGVPYILLEQLDLALSLQSDRVGFCRDL